MTARPQPGRSQSKSNLGLDLPPPLDWAEMVGIGPGNDRLDFALPVMQLSGRRLQARRFTGCAVVSFTNNPTQIGEFAVNVFKKLDELPIPIAHRGCRCVAVVGVVRLVGSNVESFGLRAGPLGPPRLRTVGFHSWIQPDGPAVRPYLAASFYTINHRLLPTSARKWGPFVRGTAPQRQPALAIHKLRLIERQSSRLKHGWLPIRRRGRFGAGRAGGNDLGPARDLADPVAAFIYPAFAFGEWRLAGRRTFSSGQAAMIAREHD